MTELVILQCSDHKAVQTEVALKEHSGWLSFSVGMQRQLTICMSISTNANNWLVGLHALLAVYLT